MEIGLTIGVAYTKVQIEKAFDTDFGARIKGITLRKKEDFRFIILFSRTNGPYTDRTDGDTFYYDGEGQGRDQILTTSNTALLESNTTPRPIYGFRQEKETSDWTYLGLLKLEGYSYTMKRGFLTYEFQLTAVGIDEAEELLPELQEVQNVNDVDEEYVTDPEVIVEQTVKKRRRDAAFKLVVKKAYHNKCAVCGKERYSTVGNPEVEAAHIYPKEKNGRDVLPNGLALCRLHHWAFDAGLFAITEEFLISVNEEILTDVNYEEIALFNGRKLYLPEKRNEWPGKIFLNARGELKTNP